MIKVFGITSIIYTLVLLTIQTAMMVVAVCILFKLSKLIYYLIMELIKGIKDEII